MRLDGTALDPRLPRRMLRQAEAGAQVATPTEGEQALDRADARIAEGGARFAAFAAEELPTFSRWGRALRDNAVTDTLRPVTDVAGSAFKGLLQARTGDVWQHFTIPVRLPNGVERDVPVDVFDQQNTIALADAQASSSSLAKVPIPVVNSATGVFGRGRAALQSAVTGFSLLGRGQVRSAGSAFGVTTRQVLLGVVNALPTFGADNIVSHVASEGDRRAARAARRPDVVVRVDPAALR